MFYNLVLDRLTLKKTILNCKIFNFLTIKLGIDPTSLGIHLGHIYILFVIKCISKFIPSLKIIIVFGDFTARLGDLSGKTFFNLPNLNEIRFNCINLKKIISFFFKNCVFMYNSYWLPYVNLLNYSYIDVRCFINRRSIKKNFFISSTINLNQLIYPIFQSLDNFFINPSIEIGGIDQKFNFLFGGYLNKDNSIFSNSFLGNNFSKVYYILTYLLIGTCGKNKMGKSNNNFIILDGNLFIFFLKIIRLNDSIFIYYWFFYKPFCSFNIINFFFLNFFYDDVFFKKIIFALFLISVFFGFFDACIVFKFFLKYKRIKSRKVNIFI